MRVLVVTNLYPPHHIGGYEIGCRDVLEGLIQRGWEIRVLTSRYRKPETSSPPEGHVFRELNSGFEAGGFLKDPLATPFREAANRKTWERHVTEFQPDLTYFWNMGRLSTWLMTDAARHRLPSACYASDHWLEHWEGSDYWTCSITPSTTWMSRPRAAWNRLWGKILGLGSTPAPRALQEIHSTSKFIENGIRSRFAIPGGSEVIHWGIHPDFTERDLSGARPPDEGFSVIISGQIAVHKGIETAVRAIAALRERHPAAGVRLRICGTGSPAYVAHIRDLVDGLGIGDIVSFEGLLPRDRLIGCLLLSSVYILASEWQEPFAIAPLEAMAAGCAVVATLTGGSPEIFQDRVNSLVFEPSNAADLTDRLELLLTDPALRRDIAARGCRQVRASHRLEQMVDRISEKLLTLIQASGASPCRNPQLHGSTP